MEVSSLDATTALNNSLGAISSYKMSGQTWHGFTQLTWWKLAAHLEANVLQYGGTENGINNFMISKHRWMHINPSGAKMQYSGIRMTMTIICLLMPRLILSLGHHPPSYWISRINMSLSPKKKFNYLLSNHWDLIRTTNIFLFSWLQIQLDKGLWQHGCGCQFNGIFFCWDVIMPEILQPRASQWSHKPVYYSNYLGLCLIITDNNHLYDI